MCSLGRAQQDGSLLFYVALAGAAGPGAGEFQNDFDMCLISWCWVLAGNSANAAFLSLGSLDFLIVVTGFQECVSQENKIEVYRAFMATLSVTFIILYWSR